MVMKLATVYPNHHMQYLPSWRSGQGTGVLHPGKGCSDTLTSGIIPFVTANQPGQRRYARPIDAATVIPIPTVSASSSTDHRLVATRRPADLLRQATFMQQQYSANAELVTACRLRISATAAERDGPTIPERIHQGDKLTLVVAYRDRLARFGDCTRSTPMRCANRWRTAWFSPCELSAVKSAISPWIYLAMRLLSSRWGQRTPSGTRPGEPGRSESGPGLGRRGPSLNSGSTPPGSPTITPSNSTTLTEPQGPTGSGTRRISAPDYPTGL